MTQALDGKKVLRSSTIFNHISETDLSILEKSFNKRTVEKGQFLFRQGDIGDSMIIIAKGQAAILMAVPGHEPQIVDHSNPGDVLGEMSFFDPAPRTASVQAVDRLYVYELDRNVFQSIRSGAPHLARDIMSGIAEVVSGRLLKMEEQIAHQLHSIKPLKARESGHVKKDDSEQQTRRQRSEGEWLKNKPDLSKVVIPKGFHPKDIELMAEVCRYIRFPKGAFLCRQNEPGMACYFILRGKADAFQELNGQTQALAMLHPGTVIGQIALVNNIRRSATLKALEDVLTLEVTRADFQQLMQSASPTALKFQEQIAITGIRQHRACMVRFSSILSQVKDAVKAQEIAQLEVAQKKIKATAKPKKTHGKEPDMDVIAKYLASLSEWGITTEMLNQAVVVQLDGEIPPGEIKMRLQNN